MYLTLPWRTRVTWRLAESSQRVPKPICPILELDCMHTYVHVGAWGPQTSGSLCSVLSIPVCMLTTHKLTGVLADLLND